MWAMIVKEFRQLRRDRRTLAMMIAMPVILLVVLGYAASFDVSSIPVAVAGPQAAAVARVLPQPFHVVSTNPAAGRAWAQDQLRDGHAAAAFVTSGTDVPSVLIDGSQLFTAQATLTALPKLTLREAVLLECVERAECVQCAAAKATGHHLVQPWPEDVGRDDSGPGGRRAGVHRHDHHQPGRRA